nr:MAG TPA_asm: hypothetical protein [Caudoviricetes sp.]
MADITVAGSARSGTDTTSCRMGHLADRWDKIKTSPSAPTPRELR